MAADLIVWHGPNTRSTGTVWLVEELGVPYELRKVDVFGGETREAEFLKINPAGKVPAIRHKGKTLTEMAAISLYLCDEFPKAGLAPAIGDPLRADYLYWSVFRPGVLEPAIVTKAQNLDVDPRTVGWGEWETVITLIETALEDGPYLLGERFSAADILIGGALGWLKHFKLMPDNPRIDDYITRLHARPAYARMQASNQ
ncbi:glutathione S-transferase family protein [Glycocaulis alkaliphilus]|nr:glutathione S-transferase family protein [Glycocaulis alkaliphilus]GGB78762.1 glutathione S-transferase [Glycocaulis alkaliphilus]